MWKIVGIDVVHGNWGNNSYNQIELELRPALPEYFQMGESAILFFFHWISYKLYFSILPPEWTSRTQGDGHV